MFRNQYPYIKSCGAKGNDWSNLSKISKGKWFSIFIPAIFYFGYMIKITSFDFIDLYQRIFLLKFCWNFFYNLIYPLKINYIKFIVKHSWISVQAKLTLIKHKIIDKVLILKSHFISFNKSYWMLFSFLNYD